MQINSEAVAACFVPKAIRQLTFYFQTGLGGTKYAVGQITDKAICQEHNVLVSISCHPMDTNADVVITLHKKMCLFQMA